MAEHDLATGFEELYQPLKRLYWASGIKDYPVRLRDHGSEYGTQMSGLDIYVWHSIAPAFAECLQSAAIAYEESDHEDKSKKFHLVSENLTAKDLKVLAAEIDNKAKAAAAKNGINLAAMPRRREIPIRTSEKPLKPPGAYRGSTGKW
jgi:hypothetical protein